VPSPPSWPRVGRVDETMTRQELEAFYRRYNRLCNEHRFDELGTYVAADVEADGQPRGLDGYAEALEAVVRAFPDYRWDIRHLLVDGSLVAGHFVTAGTHEGTFLGVPPTGRRVSTQEFAVYRVAEGRIAEVWGTADDLDLLHQLRGQPG
jgi:predicted ester cyclase